MADRDLLVRILGDDRDLQRALRNTDRSVQQIDARTATFGKNITRAFGAAGIALGTATVFQGLDASIQAASDLNEQITRSEQVFEDNAESVKDWSATLAESFGIAQAKGLEFAGTFGLLFRNLGISTDEAETFSRQLVELAADLASFNNTTVDDALAALRSGLTGEIEPLRRFGVFLSEARSNQEALAETGKKTTDSLTTQEKVLARLNIIMSDTVRAQGDFSRTSEGLANQQRKLRAQLANLSAAFGSLLIPKVLETVDAINDLAGALQRLERAIPSGGTGGDFFDELFKSLPAQIADQAENLQQMGRDIDFVLRHGPFQARGLGFEEIGEIVEDDVNALAKHIDASTPVIARIAGVITDAIDQLDAALETSQNKLEKAQAKADRRAATRAGEAFDEFVQGMSLKLDKAGLSETVDDDLEALRELEAAILRRIEREGKTFKLVEQLTSTRLQINGLVQRQAAEAEQAGSEAFNATIDALTLDLDVAGSTKSLDDDQAALRKLEQAILRRIQTEGQTTDLLRQLFQVREQQKEIAQRLADQQRERRRARQFEALGLTAEGDEVAPSVASLRRRGNTIEDQIKGTTLDTKRNRQILENAAKVLSGQFGKVGRDVRLAIERMFEEIAGALDSGDKTVGPLTKTTALNTKKFLAGLGLSPEEVNALRSRLSSFNSAGVAPGGFMSSGFNAPSGGGFTSPIVVESNVTVTLDGEKVGKSVTRSQQKARRRNPRQKRGPNRRGGDG